ncbi:MAG: competence/damage-inducible protein A [Gemmataceae bacterium]|nr:competence/damage-inducible protein A [Gemmataceae bacterium]
MKCEIVSIGSEITSGQNLDTNSQWLSRRLAEHGLAVGWHTTVADDLDANIDAFRIAARRARIVLVSGGLGPTQDDLTREALAAAARVDLAFHEPSFLAIQEMFRSRNRLMPERNRAQAMFPAGAEPIPNSCGTAPGVWMRLEDAVVAAMPGVPTEMRAMFEASVLPRLLGMGLGGGVLVERKLNTFGAGESHVEEKLFDLTRRGHVPEVGITVSDAVISLRILAHAATMAEAQALIAPVERTIRERLGEMVFGEGEETLAHAVLGLLKARGMTLATAESVTGGLIGQMLTDVPGSSESFKGGVIAYTNEVKERQLGVPAALIAEKGVVSAEVAEAMAVGARSLLGADLAVSTTGYAGPGSPAGLVWTGLAWEGGASSAMFDWTGTRAEIRNRAAKLALNRARLRLLP